MFVNLRVALRQLRKSPGFAAATIVTLALGIGATTAMFSLVNAVVLRPLPFPEQNRLVWAQQVDTAIGPTAPEQLSYVDFFAWRERIRSFSAVAVYRGNRATLTGAGEPRVALGQIVSSEFFRVLGTQPVIGRDFRLEDEQPGTPAVMLNYALWQLAFAGAADIVGKSVTLDGTKFQVAGVMPPGFCFPIQNPAPEFWMTLAADAQGKTPLTSQSGFDALEVVARLKPGARIEQARAEASAIERDLAQEHPDSNKTYTAAIVEPLLSHITGDTRSALAILLGAVGLLLAIACANAAGLLLARATKQRHDVAVRVALGASRGEITRQVLTESLLLSIAGGGLGVVLSSVILRATLRFLPNELPRVEQTSLDIQVLAFAVLASIATGLLFGVLPAWRMSRVEPLAAMQEGSRGSTGARSHGRLLGGLVIAQAAVGLVLLVGSGLLIRSFVRLLNANPGFDSRNALTVGLNLPPDRYPPEKRVQFYRELLSRTAMLPGVQAAAAGFPLPLAEGRIGVSFTIEGREVPSGDEPTEKLAIVTPSYFAALRIPVVTGREFTPRDETRGKPVIIIDQAFARKYFPGENPLGKRIRSGLNDSDTEKPQFREVVGVVGDVRIEGLGIKASPHYYLPFEQAVVTSPAIVLRTSIDPHSLVAPLRAEVARLDREIPLFRIHTFDELVYRAAAAPRFQTLLFTAFAALALILAAVGLYGVLAYLVVQKTREIGIRMALGAQRTDVVAMILRRGIKLAAMGAGLGLLASLFVTTLLEGLLYEVRPLDSATFGIVTIVLLVVAAIAAAAPALRASRLDPIATLRDQ
jgi:predicted permease